MGYKLDNMYFDVSVPFEVKHGKAAHVPYSISVHGKMAEKIDNITWELLRVTTILVMNLKRKRKVVEQLSVKYRLSWI